MNADLGRYGGGTALDAAVLTIAVRQVASTPAMPRVKRRPPARTPFATPLTVVVFILVNRLYVRDGLGRGEGSAP